MHRQKALDRNENQTGDQDAFEIEPVCEKIEQIHNDITQGSTCSWRRCARESLLHVLRERDSREYAQRLHAAI
jgi:hypothetical protein